MLTNQSGKSLNPLAQSSRRSLFFLVTLSLCLLFSGVFAKSSHAQQVYHVGGNHTESIDQGGSTSTSYVATAIGALSWDCPASGGDCYLRVTLKVDGVVKAKNWANSLDYGLLISKDALHPSYLSLSYGFTLPSGTHHIEFYGLLNTYEIIDNPGNVLFNIDSYITIP